MSDFIAFCQQDIVQSYCWVHRPPEGENGMDGRSDPRMFAERVPCDNSSSNTPRLALLLLCSLFFSLSGLFFMVISAVRPNPMHIIFNCRQTIPRCGHILLVNHSVHCPSHTFYVDQRIARVGHSMFFRYLCHYPPAFSVRYRFVRARDLRSNDWVSSHDDSYAYICSQLTRSTVKWFFQTK